MAASAAWTWALLARLVWTALSRSCVFVYIELALELVRLGTGELCLVLNELRPCLRQLALRLVKRCLKGPWIDLKEQLALPYEGPFLVIPSEQIPCDLSLNGCIHLSSQRTDPFGVNRNILTFRLCNRNGWEACSLRCRFAPRVSGRAKQNYDDKGNRSPYNELVFRKSSHLYLPWSAPPDRRYPQRWGELAVARQTPLGNRVPAHS